MASYSVSPAGEKFPLPGPEDDAREFARVQALAAAARAEGKEIVVVMGVGFVGAVMAAIVADSVGPDGKPGKFVIGCQRPSARSYWKIPLLARGESPVKAEDPEVDPMIHRTVIEKKTLVATYNSDCLSLADCVVVDVQCDYSKHDLGKMKTGSAEMSALEATMRTIGEKIQPSCLVLIETTVAPGTTEFVAWPIMKRAFAARGIESEPLLAHSFERVMPGREYVRSIRDFWRVCSGCTAEAKARTVKFLGEILNTRDFPLTVMDRPIESETTKIVENSYRATILAFLNEWSLFAERNGVDLIKVIKAIKVRPDAQQHHLPGARHRRLLPAEGRRPRLLGLQAHPRLRGPGRSCSRSRRPPSTSTTRAACTSPSWCATRCATWGATSPARTCCCAARATARTWATRATAGPSWWCASSPRWAPRCTSTIPYVDHWYELENQDDYPAPGHSWSRFFRNQAALTEIRVQKDLAKALAGAEALILAVRHKPYLDLEPDQVVKWAGAPLAVVDCFGILTDDRIRRYFELGCEVKALGRGHIQRIKEEVRGKRSRN